MLKGKDNWDVKNCDTQVLYRQAGSSKILGEEKGWAKTVYMRTVNTYILKM